MFDTPQFTRRRIVTLTGAGIAGTAGLALASDNARADAEIDMGTLDVADADFEPADGSVWAPWVLLSGPLRWSLETTPDEWQVYLIVSDGQGNTTPIGVTSAETDAPSGSATYALRGAITAADFYSASDFAVPESGEPVTVTVPLKVTLVLRTADGDVLAQASASDTAAVTVSERGPAAALAGSGEIVAQMDAGDATPTPPEGS